MKNVCFLNGHLILRGHKTGVHYFHEYVTKKIASLNKDYNLRIACFDNKNKHKIFLNKQENEWMTTYIKINKTMPRILSYILPIEFFFGNNDVYFCDGLFPHSIHHAKRICLVHDLMVKIYPENYSFIKKLYLELFFGHLRNADLIVAVSETTKKDIVKYYHVPEEKILVCYNGVNDTHLQNKKNSLDNERIDLSKRYLFYLGDMRKNKNLPNTVKGFLDFCREENVSDLYFYIAGKKNDDYSNVQRELEKSPHRNQVKFLGYISDNDKALLYKNCESVLLLSLYEGFGMPIVEGMSYYKPVITSNCSSMKEVGEGAVVLANPKDTSDISRAIGDIYYKKIVVNKDAYDKKLSIYNFDHVAKIINSAIEKCLEKNE